MHSQLRLKRDEGFTLIELLVVMIVIGVLATVAIPIFLNQQKTARDTATISDVKNLADQLHTALVNCPNADAIEITDLVMAEVSPLGHKQEIKYDDWVVDPANTMVQVFKVPWPSTEVCNSKHIRLSKGTTLYVERAGGVGQFNIYGYNPNGKKYTGEGVVLTTDFAVAATQGKVVLYRVNNGGLVLK